MFGYQMHPTEKNKIVVDENAAVIVRQIFGMALEGISCRQIAVRLNEAKIPPPSVYAGLTQTQKGAYAGLWSSERVSDMLQNETYIGNMVQGRSVKISYKSKKCQHQERKDWVVVENTHEPLIDREAFDKVQLLLNSRKHTRSRTYDFLLKGLIFCHECGYPLAVLNRKNAKGEESLYFVCRTYQRFTKAGVCTCHAIKEKTVTDAVLGELRKVCKSYLNQETLLPTARKAVEEANGQGAQQKQTASLENRIQCLTNHLDKVYMDKLSGLLAEADFQRIYLKIKEERAALEKEKAAIQQPDFSPAKQRQAAKELVERFAAEAFASRELLCGLIERIELTEDKRLIIRYRFKALEGKG